jgi:hypothetical protein
VAAQGLKKGNIVLPADRMFFAGFRQFRRRVVGPFPALLYDGAMTNAGLPGPSPVTLSR